MYLQLNIKYLETNGLLIYLIVCGIINIFFIFILFIIQKKFQDFFYTVKSEYKLIPILNCDIEFLYFIKRLSNDKLLLGDNIEEEKCNKKYLYYENTDTYFEIKWLPESAKDKDTR